MNWSRRGCPGTSRPPVGGCGRHYGVGADQQSYPPQHIAGESVQQRREESTVGGTEPHLLPMQLALQHHDLVAKGEDLRVLGLLAHRQEPQERPDRTQRWIALEPTLPSA